MGDYADDAIEDSLMADLMEPEDEREEYLHRLPESTPKKRKHGKYPYTTKSMEYIRAQGRIPWVVERLIPTGMPFPRKQDLWNLFDIAYVDPGSNRAGYVQTTSWAQRSAHKKKMLSGEGDTGVVLQTLMAMGNVDVELYGWRKVNNLWEVTVERLETESGLLGDTRLTFVAVEVPTMKAVRAEARRRASQISPELD
jgi:hypothetical protein